MTGQADTLPTSRQPPGLQRLSLDGQQALFYVDSGRAHSLSASLADLLAEGLDSLHAAVAEAKAKPPIEVGPGETLPPIDEQEIWACGVTYVRSRTARMEESVAADVYERVYTAERPEMFFKAPAWRVPPPGAPLRIRQDSNWDVPEPELALVLTAAGQVAGYLVADDVSSRQIEGENPLYLPQAKIYDDALGLSATIVLDNELGVEAASHAAIRLCVARSGRVIFEGQTSVGEMRRSFDELIACLFAELSHPTGAVLLTGTGLVPPDEVTLAPGDEVEIEIDGVGELRHTVYRRKD